MCVKGVVMSVNPITSFKANRPSSVVRNDSVVNKEDDLKKSKEGKNIKTGVALTSALGVGTALACIAKKQGFSLSPSKIKNTPIKDWAIFKIYNKKHPESRLMEIEEIEILQLAGASVAGGLAGGLVFDDKKNAKAKIRESVNQMLGNVLVPVACVGGASRLYKKNEASILKHIPQMVEKGKTSVVCNKLLKGLPSAVITIAALGVGILTGNRVSNMLNEKVFHKKVDRKIKGSDFAPHVDDLSMAVTLMAEKSALSTSITRTVPAFLCVPGVQAGLAKETNIQA